MTSNDARSEASSASHTDEWLAIEDIAAEESEADVQSAQNDEAAMAHPDDIPAPSENEPTWLKDAGIAIESFAESECDSSIDDNSQDADPPQISSANKLDSIAALVDALSAARQWPKFQLETCRPRVSWKTLVLMLSLATFALGLESRHRVGVAMSQCEVAVIKPSAALQPAAQHPLPDGITCRVQDQEAHNEELSKMELNVKQSHDDLAAAKLLHQTRMAEMADALTRSDAALSESRQELEDARAALASLKEKEMEKAQAQDRRAEAQSEKDDVAAMRHELSRERSEVVKECRRAITASEDARRAEREAWRKRLAEKDDAIAVWRKEAKSHGNRPQETKQGGGNGNKVLELQQALKMREAQVAELSKSATTVSEKLREQTEKVAALEKALASARRSRGGGGSTCNSHSNADDAQRRHRRHHPRRTYYQSPMDWLFENSPSGARNMFAPPGFGSLFGGHSSWF